LRKAGGRKAPGLSVWRALGVKRHRIWAFCLKRCATTDLCLVVPPFDDIGFPPLGVAVLAGGLRAQGLSTTVVHGSLMLAAAVGHDDYLKVCRSVSDQLLGERLFLPHAYTPEDRAGFPPLRPLPRDLEAVSGRIEKAIGPFLDRLVRAVLAVRPSIVGITTNFQQNLAAFAFARRLKAKAPHICIVMGGANVMEPMGSGLATVFPFVDHFFSGESDRVFPEFCARRLAGLRDAPRIVACEPIADMREVSAADFSDYFAMLRRYQARFLLPPGLPRVLTLESSRGCWWGAKSHCTFCGLNADGMEFRAKPPGRVLDELQDLEARWGIDTFHFADNIMPADFHRTVLPALARRERPLRLFYEVKANLRDEQVEAMARAGVYAIQPGIESLSTHVLKLMRKGVSSLQNLALLRSCADHGIDVVWNLLHGFPGERAVDYEAMAALIPKIVHLKPPRGVFPIIIDRFSPYHARHRDFGIAEIAPYKNFRGLYPAGAPVSDIAYHFTGRYATEFLADEALLRRMREAIGIWLLRNKRAGAVLRADPAPEGGALIVTDSRRGKPSSVRLSASADAALRYFARPRPHDGHPADIVREVDDLLARDFLISHDGGLLSIVTRPRSGVVTSNSVAA
jgi:ribosomal peptide maturation radical SAM protein 1